MSAIDQDYSEMVEVAPPGNADTEDDSVSASKGSGRVRVQPIDTILRLHFKQTQVFALGSLFCGSCTGRYIFASKHAG